MLHGASSQSKQDPTRPRLSSRQYYFRGRVSRPVPRRPPRKGDIETKSIDLLNLTPDTDVEVLINQIVFEEPLISENKKDTLRTMIFKLMDKIENKDESVPQVRVGPYWGMIALERGLCRDSASRGVLLVLGGGGLCCGPAE